MASFKSTRAQVVDGKHLNKGDPVEVDASRVTYLITRGYLVETDEAPKKTSKKASKGS